MKRVKDFQFEAGKATSKGPKRKRHNEQYWEAKRSEQTNDPFSFVNV